MGLFKRKKETPLVDIDSLCEKQRLLDAYSGYVVLLCTMLTNDRTDATLLIMDTPHDQLVGEAWEKLLEMKKRVNK